MSNIEELKAEMIWKKLVCDGIIELVLAGLDDNLSPKEIAGNVEVALEIAKMGMDGPAALC